MKRAELAWRASLVAARVIRRHEVSALPVDPKTIAKANQIEVRPMLAATGVSGMLLRVGDRFGIGYATHIDNVGYQNFSLAHELGHYFLEGHVDAVLAHGNRHESRAGFRSDDPYEIEADHFAAALLMPELLFSAAIADAGQGIAAVDHLASRCVTSLTATAIRYAQYTDDVVAVIVSTGKRVRYCFMSKTLQEIANGNGVYKGELLPSGTPTYNFNLDLDRIARADRVTGVSELQDWMGGRYQVEMDEDVIGLGGYGQTLTLLTARSAVDLEELEQDEELVESWRPRFRR